MVNFRFEFKEALLTCNHLPHPHTGEVISNELFQILEDWHLTSTTFIVATDNSANMVKAVRLLPTQYSRMIRTYSV